jgi:hypothetical protein
MKLGLDIHGVIDANPETFSFLSKSIIDSGGEVHIITGGSWGDVLKKEVEDAGIKYTHLFSVYDYLKSTDAVPIGLIQFPDGVIQDKYERKLWDSIKAKYSSEQGLDLHIDDTIDYGEYFTTPFLLYDGKTDIMKISHIDIG